MNRRGGCLRKPIVIRNKDAVIISLNGRKLVEPADKYKDMTDEEIVNNFINSRNIKNSNRR